MINIIKFIMIFIILIIGVSLFNAVKFSGEGALLHTIISIGMFVAIGAIWKSNPRAK
jgi:hypothetical protein